MQRRVATSVLGLGLLLAVAGCTSSERDGPLQHGDTVEQGAWPLAIVPE